MVGYVEQMETAPGVWEFIPTERPYYGDILRVSQRWENNAEHRNDNLNISNRISILADAFAYEHFHAMRYVKWMGANWKINDVEFQRPRLVLSLGGVYNQSESESEAAWHSNEHSL